MLGVAFSMVSAVLFGGMSVALGFCSRKSRDAEVGAFVTAFSGFCMCGAVALIGRELGWRDPAFSLLAGSARAGAARSSCSSSPCGKQARRGRR